MAYATRLYPRAKPRGFTLQWIKKTAKAVFFMYEELKVLSLTFNSGCLSTLHICFELSIKVNWCK